MMLRLQRERMESGLVSSLEDYHRDYGLTAARLSQLGLVDEVIEEPLGGAHRDHALISERLKEALVRRLDELEAIPTDELRAQRSAKIASFGVFSESAE